MQLIVPSGEFLAAGTMVELKGASQNTFVVGEQGDFYVAGLARHNQLRAKWNEQFCEFAIEYPQSNELIPNLGTITCEPI